MRLSQSTLYSITAPLALLPVMDFSFSEIPEWFTGIEFRAIVSEILFQVFSGVVDSLIATAFGLV